MSFVIFNSFWNLDVSYFPHHVSIVSFFLEDKCYHFIPRISRFYLRLLFEISKILKCCDLQHFRKIRFVKFRTRSIGHMNFWDRNSMWFCTQKLTLICWIVFQFFEKQINFCHLSLKNIIKKLCSQKFLYLSESKWLFE